MDTCPMTPEVLASSVIAVPPLARTESLEWNRAENERMIRYLESGGVRILLYGGNAVLNHVALSEYGELLTMLAELAGSDTVVVPSFGPTFGMMMDQARVLREYPFPTAMLLPLRDGTTSAGIGTGLRKFVDRYGRPAVLYLKHDGAVDVATVKSLMADGVISWIKYAIVRPDARNDAFLRELIDAIGPSLLVSGMGEQPAITHLRDFGMTGFTSGCVCVAPRLSMDMLRALKAKDDAAAERIRAQFQPLESLRDSLSPVRVLHAAVQMAGIAELGPISPLLSPIESQHHAAIAAAAQQLRG